MNFPISCTTRMLLIDDDPEMVRLLTKIIDVAFGERIELQPLTDPKMARHWIEERVVDILVKDSEALPPEFQRAEFVRDHGFVDRIGARADLHAELARLVRLLSGRPS